MAISVIHFFFGCECNGGTRPLLLYGRQGSCKSSQCDKIWFENTLPFACHLSCIYLFYMCFWSIILGFILLVFFKYILNWYFQVVCSLAKWFPFFFLVMTSTFSFLLGQGSFSITRDIKESLPSIWFCCDFRRPGSTQWSNKRIW